MDLNKDDWRIKINYQQFCLEQDFVPFKGKHIVHCNVCTLHVCMHAYVYALSYAHYIVTTKTILPSNEARQASIILNFLLFIPKLLSSQSPLPIVVIAISI